MTRAEQVKEASEIPVGGSEDEAKERVKQLFKPRRKTYYCLSDDEIAQLELEHWLEWIVENNKRFEGRN